MRAAPSFLSTSFPHSRKWARRRLLKNASMPSAFQGESTTGQKMKADKSSAACRPRTQLHINTWRNLRRVPGRDVCITRLESETNLRAKVFPAGGVASILLNCAPKMQAKRAENTRVSGPKIDPLRPRSKTAHSIHPFRPLPISEEGLLLSVPLPFLPASHTVLADSWTGNSLLSSLASRHSTTLSIYFGPTLTCLLGNGLANLDLLSGGGGGRAPIFPSGVEGRRRRRRRRTRRDVFFDLSPRLLPSLLSEMTNGGQVSCSRVKQKLY